MNFLRRGSKKSLVKTIHISPDSSIENIRVIADHEYQLNLVHQPEPMLSNNINTLRECLEKTENELQRLKIENERLENTKISLEDKANYFEKMCNEKETEILSLATQIEVLKLQNNELESEQCNQTYKAKTQHMTNLEEELKRVNAESTKTIKQLHKKIKRLQENHAKSKQDYALKVFALKDEKKKLIEDNTALEDRLQETKKSGDSRAETKTSSLENSGPDEDPSCTPRNKLIIQLSQQVTTLDVENQELREELERTKTLLQNFELRERTLGTRGTGTKIIGTKVTGTRSNRSSSKSKHERQQLCVSMAGLDLSCSTSKVELQG